MAVWNSKWGYFPDLCSHYNYDKTSVFSPVTSPTGGSYGLDNLKTGWDHGALETLTVKKLLITNPRNVWVTPISTTCSDKCSYDSRMVKLKSCKMVIHFCFSLSSSTISPNMEILLRLIDTSPNFSFFHCLLLVLSHVSNTLLNFWLSLNPSLFHWVYFAHHLPQHHCYSVAIWLEVK